MYPSWSRADCLCQVTVTDLLLDLQVPWSKLPAVREAAPEFYNTLKYHMSWVMVLVNFVLQRDIGPQSRVGRDYETHKRGRKLGIPKTGGQKVEGKKKL